MDSRHEKRIRIVQNLFAKSFDGSNNILFPNKEERDMTLKVIENLDKIDQTIATHAPKYPLDKIARTDLCILRLALYELLIQQDEPVKVIINEAVELGKDMGNERSYAFINAVLGSILKEINPEKI